jgi:hypothetical protein
LPTPSMTPRARERLVSRYEEAELRARLLGVDFAAVDIDECVYPGYSQADLGHLLFFAIAARPICPSDRLLLPQLLSGGAYIQRVGLVARFGLRPSNRALMRRYERSMRGIPEAYFLEEARRIPPRSREGAAETLRLLGRFVPVGLISLGVNVLTEEFARQLGREGGSGGGAGGVRFADSNRIRFAPDAAGRRRFAGYEEPLLVGAGDKLRILERRLEELGASRPLVIGNGEDESAMSELARRAGGLSVGVKPTGRAGIFDLVVDGESWIPLLELLSHVLGAGGR